MAPCQETPRSAFGSATQEQDWGNVSTIMRQDSLAYSVSDAGSNYDEDESFETYCDRMDTKEVVVIFGDGFHPFQQVVMHEDQVVDDMMEKVKAMRVSQEPAKTVKQQQGRPYQFPQPSSNKENGHAAFRSPRNAPTGMTS